VQIRPLRIPHCYTLTPVQHVDDRGVFLEWFRGDELEAATGRRFNLRQANMSVNAAGVARGIHFSDVPPGQAKYVTTVKGSVTDFLVDLRVGSPTFGEWEAVELDDELKTAVFIPEGVGHAFFTLKGGTIAYLATDIYKPTVDRSISVRDPDICLPIPAGAVFSPRDAEAPLLSAAAAFLPSWQECVSWYGVMTT
jgi:dTDP-4-dehydrorhamnose 3,5-epimerase